MLPRDARPLISHFPNPGQIGYKTVMLLRWHSSRADWWRREWQCPGNALGATRIVLRQTGAIEESLHVTKRRTLKSRDSLKWMKKNRGSKWIAIRVKPRLEINFSNWSPSRNSSFAVVNKRTIVSKLIFPFRISASRRSFFRPFKN